MKNCSAVPHAKTLIKRETVLQNHTTSIFRLVRNDHCANRTLKVFVALSFEDRFQSALISKILIYNSEIRCPIEYLMILQNVETHSRFHLYDYQTLLEIILRTQVNIGRLAG